MKRFIIIALVLLFTASTVTVLLLEARITATKEKVQFLQDQVPRAPRPNRDPADKNSRFRIVEIPWI